MGLYTLDERRVITPASGRYWVADNAVVLGDVTIEEDASVWFNVVVRGDNERITIGARSNIQDGCVLHTDPGFPMVIGPDVTVGHMAMLHGCTIGAGALIGIGAIILNGAKIGEGALVGAGALVGEGKVIPPRSLVLGSPGKVVRELRDEDVARMLRGTNGYVKNGQRFKNGFKPQT
ncbi:MAG: gamma carbonic anhydrase family protein [Hyphomicrobiaceae bacterium]|nr:gamma carbonic anhydrase family protein [Hyphomicrobiaceae bacterium]